MNKRSSLLTIVLEGEPVRSGRIPVSYLFNLLSGLQKVLYRTAEALLGEGDAGRKGAKSKQLKQILELDLIEVTHASPSTLLRFDRHSEPSLFPETDELPRILETALKGIQEIEEARDVPMRFGRGVLLAWRDVGRLFLKNIFSMTFELNHGATTLRVQFTRKGFQSIEKRILSPQTLLTTVEGRLLMADFKEEGMRLRVHPPIGDPVVCDFDEEQKEEVLENILRRVRIVGEAIEDPLTHKIQRVRIYDIEPLEDLAEAIDGVQLATPQYYDFWSSRTLEELAQIQGVKPINDITSLYRTWPGNLDDGFEEFVEKLREESIAGKDSP